MQFTPLSSMRVLMESVTDYVKAWFSMTHQNTTIHQGGFLNFKPSIPKILEGKHTVDSHFALVNYQMKQIRMALAIASLLNRTVVRAIGNLVFGPVDNGCIEHLLPFLHRDDWDVLIAHFLGVDHAWHIFGVDSGQMIDKLEQFNTVLHNVVEALQSQFVPGRLHENTLLFVMGDHGQTVNGDHGGRTAEECGALQPNEPANEQTESLSLIDSSPSSDVETKVYIGLPESRSKR